MNRKAQALLELALFVGLMLMVLLAALSYQRNLREQRLTDENVFSEAVERARNFTSALKTDPVTKETYTNSGAVVSYTLNVDRQANRIFQGGQRRTAASSVSVYHSNAEDPDNLEYVYYNDNAPGHVLSNGEVPSLEEKKIYFDRPGGTEDPEEGLKKSVATWFASGYGMTYGVASIIFGNAEWWTQAVTKWLGKVSSIIQIGLFVWVMAETIDALVEIKKSEKERSDLKDIDEDMGEWGWRVCDEANDGKDKAGKSYVKKVSPQIYATEMIDEDKSIDYDETQQANTSTRTAKVVEDKVIYKLYRRYDVTAPNPTIKLTDHKFEDFSGNEINQGNFKTFPSKDVIINLSGVQSEIWN